MMNKDFHTRTTHDQLNLYTAVHLMILPLADKKITVFSHAVFFNKSALSHFPKI